MSIFHERLRRLWGMGGVEVDIGRCRGWFGEYI